MLVAVDIDGTADAYPRQFQSLMSALKAAGHTVVVLTGSAAKKPTAADKDNKAGYLASLGLGEAYNDLVVVPKPHAKNKAQWLQDNGADLLIDNLKATAKKAAAICPVLLCWQTRK